MKITKAHGQMKSSAILREAARLVEEGRFIGGCYAVRYASSLNKVKPYVAMGRFREALYRDTESGYWWTQKISHGPRIIGLCLAAAIAESEGD